MDLTRKIMHFQAGCWDWKDIQADLETYLHRISARDLPDESQRIDFIDSMQNRLKTMAQRFVHSGKAFEALVFRAVRYQIRTFKQHQAQSRQFLLSAGTADWEQRSSRSGMGTGLKIPDTDAATMHPDAIDFVSLSLFTRRSLIVAFQNPEVLDDRALLKLARKFRLSFDWLFCIREEMKDHVFHKVARSHRLQDQLGALQVAEACPALPRLADRHQKGILKARGRMRKELKSLKPFPRHHELSQCLGVPTGTISSSLFLTRKNGLGKEEAMEKE